MPVTRASRVLRSIALGGAVSFAWLLAPWVAPAPAHAQAEPLRALVYGDSLTWEAQAGLRSAIEARLPGYQAIIRTSPGTALCDALPAMRQDGNLRVGVVVIEFVAVPFSTCMRGRDPVQAETEDLEAAIALWKARGVPVVLVGAPRAPGEAGFTDIATVNRDIAARTGETYVDSGVMLREPWSGVYQQRLPCLAGEGSAQGCAPDGTIDVRNEGHFCAVPNVGPCPVYSSGIVRFSAPIAAAAARAVRGQPAPLPVVPPTPGTRAGTRSLFSAASPGAAVQEEQELEQVENVAIAKGAVLNAADVPADLTEEQPGTEYIALTDACDAIRGAASAMSEMQAQTAFSAAGDLASVDSFVSMFASQRRARATFRAYAAPEAVECLQRGLAAGIVDSSIDTVAPAAITVARVTRTTGDTSVGYAVSSTIATAAGSITRHQLIEVVRVGRGIAASVFTNVQSPPPEATTVAMRLTVEARLAAGVESAGRPRPGETPSPTARRRGSRG